MPLGVWTQNELMGLPPAARVTGTGMALLLQCMLQGLHKRATETAMLGELYESHVQVMLLR